MDTATPAFPRHRLLLILGAVVFFCLLPYAAPRYSVTGKATFTVLDDYTGAIPLGELSQVPASRWRPLAGGFLHYYTQEPKDLWVRAHIAPEASATDAMVMETAFPFLRQVDFHLVPAAGSVNEAVVSLQGTERPIPDDHVPSTFYTFSFKHDRSFGEDVLLHVRSTDLTVVPLLLVDAKYFNVYSTVRAVLLGVFVGALLLMVCYFSAAYVVLHERIFAYFVAMVLCELLFMGEYANLGLSRLFMAPEQLFFVSGHSVTMAVGGMVLFNSLVFLELLGPTADYHYHRRVIHIIVGFIAASILVAPLLPMYWCNYLIITTGVVAMLGGLGAGLLLINFDQIFMPVLGLAGIVTCGLLEICRQFNLLPAVLRWDLRQFTEHLVPAGIIWNATFATMGIVQRMKQLQQEKREIIEALRHGGPSAKLNHLLGNVYQRQLGDGKMDLSIMFIDIVGFSRVADLIDSAMVFRSLRHCLDRITEIVEANDGVVDRSLGDGILCFFGYSRSKKWPHHAAAAFHAAKAIQEEMVAAGEQPPNPLRFNFPLRIGINTAETTIGNLGGRSRIDFSIIGGGVNFASRLESACAPYRIILSESTHKWAASLAQGEDEFAEIYVAVKHQAELAKAYEYDPFATTPGRVLAAQRRYFEVLGERQLESRHQLRPGAVSLSSDLGTFRLIDFAHFGFGAIADHFIGQKALLEVELIVADKRLARELRDKLLHRITVEVRWSRRTGAGYLHGLKLVGLNEEQREHIFALMYALSAAKVALEA